MKKALILSLIVLLLCGLVPAYAGAPTESEIPAVGTEINGFVVTDTRYLEYAATDLVKLEHKKTGAVLFWMANDNINRSFMISFRTPVYKNTGLPHVFEHAVLDGSEKYPGTGTFNDLDYKTTNTFLNAFTYQFVTQYPMASTSEDQLLAYMDYYLNGVFHPLVLTNEYAKMQEASRYELSDPEGEISINGVVYNEMKGAITLAYASDINFRSVYNKGSYRSTVSGGDPDEIPELTMEDIRTFHSTYYHPSNSLMVLTGDVELGRFLEKLDRDFFAEYDRREPLVVEDPDAVPLAPGFTEKTFEFPTEEGSAVKDASIIRYGFSVPGTDMETINKGDFLASYFANDDTPFMKAITEKMPNASVSVEYDPEASQIPAFIFVASNVNESDKTLFKEIVDGSIAEVLDEGISETILSNMLNGFRYNGLLAMDSIDYYIDKGRNWGYFWALSDGNTDAGMEDDAIMAQITDYITVDSLTETLHRFFDHPDSSVMAITVPVPGKAEEKAAALRTELDAMKAAMSPEEIDALIKKTADFYAWLDESGAVPFAEELNAVRLADMPEEIQGATAETEEIDGIRVFRSELDTPLVYVSLQMDADTVPFDSLFDYMFYTYLIGDLGTEKYPRESLENEMGKVSYGMSFSLGFVEYPDNDYSPKFRADWYTLEEDLEKSFDMAEEILFHTEFTDHDYIRAIAAQILDTFPQTIAQNSIFKAVVFAEQAFSPAARYEAHFLSDGFFDYLAAVENASDEEMDTLVRHLAEIQKLLLNRNGLDVLTFGSKENMDRVSAAAVSFAAKLDGSEPLRYSYDDKLSAVPYNQAYAINDSVAYNVVITKAAYFPELNRGVWNVVKNIVSNEILLPELRYKGGAYGAYTGNYSWDHYLMYTYRDPAVASSYEVFKTVGDLLRKMEISEEELESYQISQYGNTIMPSGPMSTANTALTDAISGKDTFGRSLEMTGQIKAMTKDDIAKYAVIFDAMSDPERSGKVTFGAKSLIEASADEFGLIDYHFMGGEDAADPEATEIIDVLSAMSAEEIAEMLSSMSPDDLQSLMSYVMDYFTDGDGNVDFGKVFALVGENIPLDGLPVVPDTVEDLLSGETNLESVWTDVVDSLFSEIDMQQVTDVVSEVFAPDADQLENFVSGVVGAFLGQFAE